MRPIGAALGGLVGLTGGAPARLVLACAGFCAQAGLILASAVRTLQRLPASA